MLSKALMNVTPRPDAVFVDGKGSWLTDSNGRRFLDFSQGWAVNSLGHSHKVVVKALFDQAKRVINTGPAFYNAPMLELAQLITNNSCFDEVFFANSGAEANEGAIKLARKWGAKHKGGAHEIITMHNGFHGRTLATMSASGKPGWDDLYEPKVSGFPKAHLNDLAAVETLITDRTVAVLLELIQGEAGVIEADIKYVHALRKLTEDKNILLIVDEIQTGVGRTGYLFLYEFYGIEPDVITLGKGLGGGVPISALCAKRQVCSFEYGDQGGTYNGNPLVSAVSCAVFRVLLESGFLQKVRSIGLYLKNELTELARSLNIGHLRGRGLIIALILNEPVAQKVVNNCLREGLIINSPRPNVIRFTPSLLVNEKEIDHMMVILKKEIVSVLGQ
jgi:acetylornithine/N-succinyldiaminopimelate aminotransferase